MNEVYTFQGLCNRVNGLISALLKWESDFLVRWPENDHLPCSYQSLFKGSPRFQVTSQRGGWPDEVKVESTDFGDTFGIDTESSLWTPVIKTGQSHSDIRSACLEIIELAGGIQNDRSNFVGVHCRQLSRMSVISPKEFSELIVSNSQGHKDVFMCSDTDAYAYELKGHLEDQGFRVVCESGAMTSDMNRSEDSIVRFKNDWLQLSTCRLAFSNCTLSTVLDLSRGLGNKVFSVGEEHPKLRAGCVFYNSLDFGSHILES